MFGPNVSLGEVMGMGMLSPNPSRYNSTAIASLAGEHEIANILDSALSGTRYAGGGLAIPETSYVQSDAKRSQVEELLCNIHLLVCEHLRVTSFIAVTHLALSPADMNNGVIDRLVDYHTRSQHLGFGINALGKQLREQMTPTRVVKLIQNPFGNCPVGFLRSRSDGYLVPIDLTTWPRYEDNYFFGNLPQDVEIYIDGVWY